MVKIPKKAARRTVASDTASIPVFYSFSLFGQFIATHKVLNRCRNDIHSSHCCGYEVGDRAVLNVGKIK
jgi:hypothetical protein